MDIQNLRIIFMGTPDFSNQILLALLENKFNIISVYTQSDKKVGRKQEIQKSQVKITAQKYSIPVFEPAKLRAEIENIRAQAPDLIIVAAYGKIIPTEILAIPKFKCINVHPSLLPKYRGASPIQNALLNGETQTGTTIMLMAEDVDAGDILKQEKITIEPTETLPELSQKLSKLSAEILIETIPDWIQGKIVSQKQNAEEATFCQMLSKEDGQIDWNEPAEKIYNRYRAFQPWPGIFTFWNGKRLKFNQITWKKSTESAETGKVIQSENNIAIQAKGGIIILKEIQIEGKPQMEIKNFINGYRDFLGSILK